MSTVPADEIHEKYLRKAITEINELGDEIAKAAGGAAVPVLGSGHPLADVFLLKHSPLASEAQEGVAFYGRAGQAVLKSLQRLRVDPMAVYGTNCVKFAGGAADDEARGWLTRELHIVQPKLIVVMGEDALAFLNDLSSRSRSRSSRSSASCSSSRRRCRRSSSRTSTRRSTSSPRRPRSGTRSRCSAPGGRSCLPTKARSRRRVRRARGRH